jgi:hypothetical protein
VSVFQSGPMPVRSTPLAPLALLCVGLSAQVPAAAQVTGLRTESLPTSVMLGAERVRLPEGEHMGLVGATLLFEAGQTWGLGPAVYGAASGRRGGFFVGGIEVQRRWDLGDGLALATGLFAGGGGGAAAPVGSGLMLRPAITLLQDVGRELQAGLSWSSVRFPDGHIASQQLGLVLAWRGDFRHYAGAAQGTSVASGTSTGLGFDRMLATLGRYRLSDGSGRSIGLVGARAERRTLTEGLTWGVEAAAAASGNAAGYMELLGTTAWSLAPLPEMLPSWRIGLRGSLGLGGGGAVPTGGGMMLKGAATMEFSPRRGWTVGAEAGRILGTNGPLRGTQAQVWFGIDLEPALDGRIDGSGKVVHTEWSAVLQHHARSARKDGSRKPLETIGLKLNRYVGENIYLSGQAHSAFGGGAGAYSIGLVGVGIANRPSARTRLGAELLVGAAGGGGVETSGGAILQGLLWAGGKVSPVSEWRIGGGLVRSRGGNGLDSPVIEVSWSRAFDLGGP